MTKNNNSTLHEPIIHFLFHYPKKIRKTWLITISAFLAIASAILLVFSYPIPIFPEYLKFDFSDAVILWASFLLPWSYVFIIIFVKSLLAFLLNFIWANTIVGIFASWLASMIFVGSFIFLIYLAKKLFGSKLAEIKFKRVILYAILICCLILSVISVSVLMTLFNQLFILKLYGIQLPADVIYITFLPFNLLKFAINAIALIVLFVPLTKVLNIAHLI